MFSYKGLIFRPFKQLINTMSNDETDLTADVHTKISLNDNELKEFTQSDSLLTEQVTVQTSTQEHYSNLFQWCLSFRNSTTDRLLLTLVLIVIIVVLEVIPISDYTVVKSIKRDVQMLLLGNSSLPGYP